MGEINLDYEDCEETLTKLSAAVLRAKIHILEKYTENSIKRTEYWKKRAEFYRELRLNRVLLAVLLPYAVRSALVETRRYHLSVLTGSCRPLL